MSDGPLDDSAVKKMGLPAEYEIPEALIAQWQALPKEQKFVPNLPRLAWDRLYQAIEQVNAASMQSVGLVARLLTKSIGGPSEGTDEALEQFAAQNIKTHNALRQFQEMIMIAAIKETAEGLSDGR